MLASNMAFLFNNQSRLGKHINFKEPLTSSETVGPHLSCATALPTARLWPDDPVMSSTGTEMHSDAAAAAGGGCPPHLQQP